MYLFELLEGNTQLLNKDLIIRRLEFLLNNFNYINEENDLPVFFGINLYKSSEKDILRFLQEQEPELLIEKVKLEKNQLIISYMFNNESCSWYKKF